MLTPSDLANISALDAALAKVADDADAAAATTQGSFLTLFSSTASGMAASARANADSERQWLAAWRAQRDALLVSPDYDPDAAAGLAATAQDHLRKSGAVVELAAAVSSAVPNAVRDTATSIAKGAAAVGKSLGDAAKNAAKGLGVVAYVLPLAALGLALLLGWVWLAPPGKKGAPVAAVRKAFAKVTAKAKRRGRS